MAINTIRLDSDPDGSNYDQDDVLINKILNGAETGEPLDFENIGDTVGKADDAVDYENISDDDLLPDEESQSLSGVAKGANGTSDGDLSDFMRESEEGAGEPSSGYNLDDLFGDSELIDDSVEPEAGVFGIELPIGDLRSGISPSAMAIVDEILASSPTGTSVDLDVEMLDQFHPEQPAPEDLVKQYFPDFSPHKILSFISLFKPKHTTLSVPHFDPPTVCVPKRKLEMAVDDRSYFLKTLNETSWGSKGVITISQAVENMGEDAQEIKEDVSQDIIFEKDLALVCEDWDSKLDAMMATPPPSPKRKRPYEGGVEEVGNCDSRPGKVRFPNKIHYSFSRLKLVTYSV